MLVLPWRFVFGFILNMSYIFFHVILDHFVDIWIVFHDLCLCRVPWISFISIFPFLIWIPCFLVGLNLMCLWKWCSSKSWSRVVATVADFLFLTCMLLVYCVHHFSLALFIYTHTIICLSKKNKNENGVACDILAIFCYVQNNLHELWSLLNFLLPEIFSSAETFDEWFQISGDNDQQEVVQQLHKVNPRPPNFLALPYFISFTEMVSVFLFFRSSGLSSFGDWSQMLRKACLQKRKQYLK